MINNKLKINDKKTEFLIFKYFYNKANFDDVILEVGNDEIAPSTIAKNLGVVIDYNLKLDKYINATCKSSFYHIRNIGRIRDCLTDDCAAIIIHAFVTLWNA